MEKPKNFSIPQEKTTKMNAFSSFSARVVQKDQNSL
jgi:hypothetical protein